MIDKLRACTFGGSCGVGLLGLLCPLCIPAIAAFLVSIGLGFVATKEVIWPLLGLLSLIFLYGLWYSYRCHRHMPPLILGLFGITAIPLGNYVIGTTVLTYTGVAAAIGAAFWNMVLRKRCTKCRS
jgi:hypothetical protein